MGEKVGNFTHLHLHTEYSLLDGYARIEKTLDKAKDLKMEAVAITDHGSMFGCVKFYTEAKKRGIKPIIGCEVYIAKGDHRSKTPEDRLRYHLVLLCENEVGYKNLIKIVSQGYVDGFYYKPRVDKDVLRKNSEGIICLSACLQGEVQQAIVQNDYEKAKNLALEYEDIFGKDHFYLELQDHGIREQKIVNRYLNQIHEETGIPLVCTNDVHYTDKKDHDAHEVLLCIQTGKTINDEGRMSFPSREFYFKSYEEMNELFSSYDGAIENTMKIANMCNFDFDFDTRHLPNFKVPEGFTNLEYLRKLVNDGLIKRYGEVSKDILERARFELDTIEEMGFVDYFLIVWDFIRFAKSKDIAVGPGRGSAAGSIVSYCLEITEIDPIKYGLLFERFLNPERISMPDIDIDFCYERRDEVIDYVREKYGEDHVAQIATLGTMKAKNAIRDVGRALDISLSKVDYIAKLIPNALNITIDKAFDMSPELVKIYNEEEEAKELIDYAKDLENMPRHTSTHAAGVVIAGEPIYDLVPLSRNKDQITTEYDMNEIEELGLLKMDFLGLRTLTVIQDAVKLIKEDLDIDIDILNIDLEDKKVLDIFSKSETIGIFQFESAGMRSFLKELRPDRFGDLIAANALFRPGPMDQIPTYIKYRHNPGDVKYIHPSLEPILKDTYGVIVYQEQVMEVAVKLAGYSMGGADSLRRAMSKKKMDVILENRESFVNGSVDENGNVLVKGCIRNGIDENTANKIYDLMVDFAKYAFNKSHSVSYAFVAMQTAYLKVYYPKEFMAALLSSIMNETSKVSLYIQESKKIGVDLLGPNINYSYKKFSVEDGKIRFGLLAVKNVGENFIDTIVFEREKGGKFTDLKDFIYRLSQSDENGLNKKAVESLIMAGAFSDFDAYRSQLMAIYEGLIDSQSKENRINVKGQMSLFGLVEEKESSYDTLPNLGEYSKKELLAQEKAVLGVYVSGHPFDSYSKKAELFIDANTIDFSKENLNENQFDLYKAYNIGGIIIDINVKFTKKNQQMAFFTIEDLYGSIEVVCFPRQYEKYKNLIEEDMAVIINGKVDTSDEENAKIILNSIRNLDDISQKEVDIRINNSIDTDKKEVNKYNYNRKIKVLYLQMKSTDQQLFKATMEIMENNPGDSRVVIYFKDNNKKIGTKDKGVSIDNSIIKKFEKILGKENVVYK